VTAVQGMQNLRDLGGLATVGGRKLRQGALLRSDAPLPDDPTPQLEAWPPGTVLDLRSESEWSVAHPLEGTGAAIHTVPFADGLNATNTDPTVLLEREGLAGLYRSTLAQSTSAVVRAVTVLASAELPVLVHCAHGKDRTGILVAIVLDALGVARKDIVADYVATAPNMSGVLDRLAPPDTDLGAKVRKLAAAFPEAADAPESALQAVFDQLDDVGGAAQWLLACGVEPSTLVALNSLLVES